MSVRRKKSKTKKSKCGYCYAEILDQNLREHCKQVHDKPKLVKGQKRLSFRGSYAALFDSVRVILHCICEASVKVSVESVVESLVSRYYENHFNSSRHSTKKHAREEMIIAENGPLLQRADQLLERAMTNYWRMNGNGEWHFLRRYDDIRTYSGGSSKVVGKLLEGKSKLPFMEG